jgi:hypothetical protein
LRIHRADDPHLERRLKSAGDRWINNVAALLPAPVTMSSRRSSFAFVSGFGARFRLPDAQAWLE